MALENLTGAWAGLLLGSLADAGVTDVVLSPGSRSTPFMVAAELEIRLRCHDAIDERAAAFFALGQARVTGRPTVILCTSGTAGAHYFPAVVEASMARLPLVVITADRPLEAQHSGAAQTIDQVKLFGDAVRRFYELGTPDPAPTALAGLRRIAAQAVHTSVWPVPGPVHLNARARKPLEPVAATTPPERALEDEVAALRARPIATAALPSSVPDAEAVEHVARLCRGAQRGLIVCGPISIQGTGRLRSAVTGLARRTGFPVLAEATSQLRFGMDATDIVTVDAFDALLRSPRFRELHVPDVVIQLGAPPVSTGWEQLAVGTPGLTRVVVAEHGWNDPEGQVSTVLLGDPATTVEHLVAHLRALGDPVDGGPASTWAGQLARLDTAARAAADAEAADGALGEGAVVCAAVELAPEGSALMVGNSLPIRLVDAFCPSMPKHLDVLCQRGANGIDGLVAGAAGSASVLDRPLTLLLGDISFLHDVGGLALARHAAAPMVVVVIQNRGGRIFEQLPLASSEAGTPAVMAHVVTPNDVDLEHAALLYGIGFARATTVDELRKHIDAAHSNDGCTVIEAVVGEHGAIEAHRRIWAAVDAAAADHPDQKQPDQKQPDQKK